MLYFRDSFTPPPDFVRSMNYHNEFSLGFFMQAKAEFWNLYTKWPKCAHLRAISVTNIERELFREGIQDCVTRIGGVRIEVVYESEPQGFDLTVETSKRIVDWEIERAAERRLLKE